MLLNRNNMLPIILSCCASIHLFVAQPTFGQQTKSIRIKSGKVYQNGESVLTINKKPIDKWSAFYTLSSADDRVQATLKLSSHGNRVLCHARFPILGRLYECYYSKVGIEEIIESYFKNGVLVKGKANLVGLAKYCKERNMPLQSISAISKARRENALKDLCQRCREAYLLCQVRRAKQRENPPPGVTIAENCESKFRLCSFGGSHHESEKYPNKKPCGDPR